MRLLKIAIILSLLFSVSSYCVHTVYNLKTGHQQRISKLAHLPPSLIEWVSMEFKGLAARYILLNVLSFMGEKNMLGLSTSDEEWSAVHKTLKLAVLLDPKATDAYILAATTLPWEAGMVDETNELLEIVAKERQDDYRPYFFLWYNYYHFLKDIKAAGDYLKQASLKPGAPKYLIPLATRMDIYNAEVPSSIIFLKEVLKDTTDPSQKEYLTLRLNALERIDYLEKKIQIYHAKFNKYPEKLEDLVTSGFILKIPEDPYGGQFYLITKTRVYTTSELVLKKTDDIKQ